jgi:hypothetical protein
MRLKTCAGTKTKEGCGKVKPIKEFYKTKQGRESLCRHCSAIHKRIMRHEKSKMDKIINGAWR